MSVLPKGKEKEIVCTPGGEKVLFPNPLWKFPRKPGNPLLGLNQEGFKHKP